MKITRTTAIILAGGIGVRMKTMTPKQFLRISGKPVLVHTLAHFVNNEAISDIVVVCPKEYLDDVKEIIGEYKIGKVRKIVCGGRTRQESSFNGLKACPRGTEYVLMHDAVRPFVDKKIIDDTLNAAKEVGASDTVIDTADTIIVQKGHLIDNIPDRTNLKRGQTPQGFRYKDLIEAHKWAIKKGITNSTDDCRLVLTMGKRVKVVPGSVYNIKLTDQTDLYLAERLFQLKSDEIEVLNYGALRGKVAIVVGGSGGIGREIVALFKKFGCCVIAVSKSTPIKCDITEEESIRQCFDQVMVKHKRIDIVVNSAGVLKISEIEKMRISEWDETVKINLSGAFKLSKAFIAICRKTNKGGHIVHLGSSSYTRGRAGYAAYSASKAGLVNFCQALADEVLKYGIYVNVVSPQRVATEMRTKGFGPEKGALLLSPAEVAHTVVKACMIKETGQVFDVRTQK